MRKCLDEGQLQAYLDGELPHAERARIESHLAACAACAASAREAEGELSVFASAFALEEEPVVPSQRLRERIEAAIGAQAFEHAAANSSAAKEGGVRRWLAALAASLSFATPRAAAFAGVAALVVCGTILWVVWSGGDAPGVVDLARVNAPAPVQPAAPTSTETPTVTTTNAPANDGADTPTRGSVSKQAASGGVMKANYRAAIIERRESTPQARGAATAATPATEEGPVVLPGEEKYLESIASLSRTAGAVGNLALQPSVRAEYERNLALVEEAIVAARRNALRSPKDEQARKFLFNAYESKVELLSTVVGQGQVAALAR